MVEDNAAHVGLDWDPLYAVTQCRSTNDFRGTAKRFGFAMFSFEICGHVGHDEALTGYSADAVTISKKRTSVLLSSSERDCLPADKGKSN
jgi:hypothetical protein